MATKHVYHDAMFVCDDACTNVVGNSYNLAIESKKPLIHGDTSFKKVNLTFKRRVIVLKLAKNSRNSLTSRPQTGLESRDFQRFAVYGKGGKT